MIHASRAAIRRWLEALLHVHDSPRRTAGAFALGIFFGFSPFLGLHTLLALGFAFVLNLNRVAVLLGVYANLPWTIGPWYLGTTALGARLLGTSLPPDFAARLYRLFDRSLLDQRFWQELGTLLRPFLWPYAVGSTLGAALLAAAAYRLALAFVVARRRHLLHHRHRNSKPTVAPDD